MVTRNYYALRLMSWEVGVTLQGPAGASLDPPLHAAFPYRRGSNRWAAPSWLQYAGTVFVMTVQKSQGSEFQQTVPVLPTYSSPVISRELAYTVITQARQSFKTVGHLNPLLTLANLGQQRNGVTNNLRAGY